MTSAIGQPVARIDGRAKVTGQAKYGMDAAVPGAVHAHLVTSTVARGQVLGIYAAEAERAPGVLVIITAANAPRLTYGGEGGDELRGPVDPRAGRHLRLLQDGLVRFGGQIVAVAVAETREQAEHAARIVRVRYAREPHVTDLRAAMVQAREQNGTQPGVPREDEHSGFDQPLPGAAEPSAEEPRAKPGRGDPRAAYAAAPVKLDATYGVPTEHHNPIALVSTTAEWHGPDRLTLHDTTQWTHGVQAHVAWVFGLAPESVRVVAPFTGGAFGCTLRTWPHVVAAAMAAQVVGRPVKLTLTRAQMFAAVGHRPETRNRIRLSADRSGKLASIEQSALHSTSRYEEFTEFETSATRFLYACANISTSYRIVPVDVQTPTWMRAPGENTNIFALESAMDELSYRLGLDPVELRLMNHDFESNPDDGRPWASNGLRRCYIQGAEAFGWTRRVPEPRSMRAGRMLVGYGVSAATYPTHRMPASAAAAILADGSAEVRSAATDIGVGTYTALAQVAADALGLPVERVRVRLGDTALPRAPMQGGSNITASVGSAVHAACLDARRQVLALACGDGNSPLAGATDAQVEAGGGRLFLAADDSRGESYVEILARHGRAGIEGRADTQPDPEAQRYSAHAFGVRFAEVRVDPDTGVVHVHRFLSVTDGGRIINPRQARSQMMGGTMMSLGMALSEATTLDHSYGRISNANLPDYAIPVHADAPEFGCIFVDAEDRHTTPLGLKGIGEVAAVGVAPAIANAVFHATGRRVRDLPITPEKLL